MRAKKPSSVSTNAKAKTQARRITGQGLTEYIVIVALIALASIAAVNLFGGAIQGAFGGMALVLGGESPDDGAQAAADRGGEIIDQSDTERNLGNYTQ